MASESRAAQLQSKVAELELLLDSCKSKTSVVGGCVPYLLVIAIAFPFFMWAVLYFGKPGFVQRKEGSKMVRDGKKVFMWVVILTLVVWAGLYGYNLWRNCGSCQR